MVPHTPSARPIAFSTRARAGVGKNELSAAPEMTRRGASRRVHPQTEAATASARCITMFAKRLSSTALNPWAAMESVTLRA